MGTLTASSRVMAALQTDVDVLPVEFQELTSPLLQAASVVVGFAIVLIVGWIVLEPAVSRIVRKRNQNNPTLEEAISRYVRLLVLVAAVFVGLSVAGFTDVIGNSALVIAAGTLALGVAGQSVIGSFVSGVALVADPQFNIGNYIRWEGGEGEVRSITLRVTRVQTPDGGLVTIPNTTLTGGSVVRPYEQGRCRTNEYITVSYDDDIENVLYLLTDITEGIDCILDEPAPKAWIDELGDDAVVIRIQYWVEDPGENMHQVRSAFAREVKFRLENADVEISPASKRDIDGRITVDKSE